MRSQAVAGRRLSVAFTREESVETAPQVELPNRNLAASEFGHRVGTRGADPCDERKSRCL
jgi:hypothetical protein